MANSSELTEEILRIVADEWKHKGLPLLLSVLGARLSESAKNHVRANNIALKRFISENASDRTRLLRMERHGGGVAPLAETDGMSDDRLEAIFESAAPLRTMPRYKFRVWRAFSDAVPVGARRFLSILASGVVQVTDTMEAEHLEGAHEVLSSDIVPDDIERYASARHEAIVSWAARNGVDHSKLIMVRTPEVPGVQRSVSIVSQSDSTPPTSSDAASASISRLLGLLTKDELARIQIPADLVLAVLERAIRK